MSTASSVEPQGSTQLLRWVATELAILALLFGLAVIRHDHVCFICFFLLLFSFSMCTKEGSAKYYHHSNLPWVSSDSCGHFHKRDFFPCFSCAEAADLKQEERLQELESCSGVGSTSDDTEVREVSSRPSTPGLSVVSGIDTLS